jgi:hypothetical protein
MKKQSEKNQLNGLLQMKSVTRFFFFEHFGNALGEMDKDKAAAFFCVTRRTVNNWLRTGCPTWVDNYVDLYKRAIPNNKEWRGFSFSHDGSRLLTPYANQSYSPGDLLKHFYDKQFSALTRVERDKLAAQLAAVRSEEEAEAIRTELDYIAKTLEKLKLSPILAPSGTFNTTVKK